MNESDSTPLSDSLEFICDVVKLVFQETLKDQFFESFRLSMNSKLGNNPDFLDKKIRGGLNRHFYMTNVSELLVHYQFESKKEESSEHMAIVRKIIHLAFKVEKDLLVNLYKIMKNVISFNATDIEKISSKNEEVPLSRANSLEMLGGKELLGKKLSKTSSQADSDASLKRSNNNDSFSTFDLPCPSKRNMLKNITYQTNSIGNMIINLSNKIMPESHEKPEMPGKPEYEPHSNNLIKAQDKHLTRIKALQASTKFNFDPISIDKLNSVSKDGESGIKPNTNKEVSRIDTFNYP